MLCRPKCPSNSCQNAVLPLYLNTQILFCWHKAQFFISTKVMSALKYSTLTRPLFPIVWYYFYSEIFIFKLFKSLPLLQNIGTNKLFNCHNIARDNFCNMSLKILIQLHKLRWFSETNDTFFILIKWSRLPIF